MNQSHQTEAIKPKSASVKLSVWHLGLTIFWTPEAWVAAGLGLCHLQHTRHVSQFQAGSTPQLLMCLVVLSWCWCLQNAGVSTAPEMPLLASLQGFWTAMWCQASASLYGHSNPGASAALEASFTSVLSSPRTVPSLSCSQTQEPTGRLIVSTESSCQQGAYPRYLWTTAPVCWPEEPCHRRCLLSVAGLLLPIADSSVPPD